MLIGDQSLITDHDEWMGSKDGKTQSASDLESALNNDTASEVNP